MRLLVKFALAAVVLLNLLGAASAGLIPVKGKWRIADAADACFASCANQVDSCKRSCPTTFSTPCVGACDSQAQTCRQSCQK